MLNKIFMRTFGCQMNVRDSEVISGLLHNAGYKICASDKEADVIIFNTCSVRKHAEDRVWSLIGSYKSKKVIGLVGCMAQHYQEKAFEHNPDVDFVVGPQDISKLPEILSKICNKGLLERKIWETDSQTRSEDIYHTGFYQDKQHAFVVISEGCSNFCSYCVVPYVRGALRHRKHEDILAEIKEALAQGVTRLTLLGQNVNAYQSGGASFIKLLALINALNELKEFDFFTSHPKDAHADLFKSIRDLEKLAKSLHLPVQSGSDRILKLMNRGYSGKEYLALVDSYRKIVKGGRITSDIIVGFPTETELDFKQTCALIKQARFDAAYIFKYSPRPKTEAAKITQQLKPEKIEKRHKEILDLQRGISKELGSRWKDAKK